MVNDKIKNLVVAYELAQRYDYVQDPKNSTPQEILDEYEGNSASDIISILIRELKKEIKNG